MHWYIDKLANTSTSVYVIKQTKAYCLFMFCCSVCLLRDRYSIQQSCHKIPTWMQTSEKCPPKCQQHQKKISGDDVDIYSTLQEPIGQTHLGLFVSHIFWGRQRDSATFALINHQCVHWPPWHKSKSQINQTRLCCKPFGMTSRFIHFLHHGSSLTILPGKGRLELSTSRNVWEAWVIAEMPLISCNTSVASDPVSFWGGTPLEKTELQFGAFATSSGKFTSNPGDSDRDWPNMSWRYIHELCNSLQVESCRISMLKTNSTIQILKSCSLYNWFLHYHISGDGPPMCIKAYHFIIGQASRCHFHDHAAESCPGTRSSTGPRRRSRQRPQNSRRLYHRILGVLLLLRCFRRFLTSCSLVFLFFAVSCNFWSLTLQVCTHSSSEKSCSTEMRAQVKLPF